MRKEIARLAILGVCVAGIAGHVRAQDGTFDPQFGNGGLVEIPWPAGGAEANAIAIDAQGRIAVGGYASGPYGDMDFALFRLMSDGTLDSSYASPASGFRLLDFDLTGIGGRSDDQINDLAVLADGAIVMVGEAHFGLVNSQFAVAKVDAAGMPDPAFGNAGIAHFGFETFQAIDQGQLLRVDSTGRLLLVGTAVCTCTSLENFDYRLGIARLTPTGLLDTQFQGGGRYVTPLWGDKSTAPPTLAQYSFPASIVVDTDERITIAGTIEQPFPQGVALMRAPPDGGYDTYFGTEGIGRVLLPQSPAAASTVWPVENGKLIVSGSFGASVPDTAFLARLNDDGSFDSSFANDGIATRTIGSGEYLSLNFLAPIRSGGWLLAGQYGPAAGSTGSSGIILVRFDKTGNVDATFGTDGVAMLPAGFGTFSAHRAALQPDGKLVIAGSLPNSALDATPHFAVVRILADYDALFSNGFDDGS